MDPNVIAALSGAVVGGLLTYLSTYFLQKKNEKKEKDSIGSGFKSELINFKSEMLTLIDQADLTLKDYLLRRIDYRTKVMINRGSNLLIIKSNLNKIGLFDQETSLIISKLLTVHGVIEETTAWINGNTPDSKDYFGKGPEQVLKSMKEDYKRSIELSDSIIISIEKQI